MLDIAPAHCAYETTKLLWRQMLDFISGSFATKQFCLNMVDYNSATAYLSYGDLIHWRVDMALWHMQFKACMCAEYEHFEHAL